MLLVVVGTILVFIFRHSIKTVLKTINFFLLWFSFCDIQLKITFFSRCADCEFSVYRGEETSGDGERSSDKTRPTFGSFILCAVD